MVQVTLEQQEDYGFILKMKQLILTMISQILMVLNLSSIEADEANGILKNTATPTLIKYLNNFPRAIETLLINYKLHCILSANGNDNDDTYCNSKIYTIKDTKLYVLVVTLSAKIIKTFWQRV